ncbi:MAG TPA: hypothetical protein VMM16_04455 [Verrucomicrobiae bacterium]|nr:hypothetical protein [Verrucomicrobiae bacterium]
MTLGRDNDHSMGDSRARAAAAGIDRPVFWAETKFALHAPHTGFNRANWKAKRAGRTLRVSLPMQREKLDEKVRSVATERGCDCPTFWVMHPEDARAHELFATTTYVCQAQIESD